MLTPHNVELYAVGKGILSIAEFSGGAPGSYEDMGNCTSFEIEPTVERLPHYSSRSGFRTKDKNVVIQAEYTVTFELDEMAGVNVTKFVMGTLTSNVVNFLTTTGLGKEYALKFSSSNPVGPDFVWDLWKMTLTPNGSIQLIGEEWMVMSFTGEGLADTVNQAAQPYGICTFATTTTTTTTTTST